MAFGLPGSGKRVQVAELCRFVEERGQTCQVIEVGNCLRSMVAQDTSPVAMSLAEVMHKGRLVPEIFPLYILAKEVIENPLADVVIVDGFGRRLSELKMVLSFLEMLNYRVEAFLLDVSVSEARERLLSRGRVDDTPDAIDSRIRIYCKDTKVALRYLRRNKDRVCLHVVDGVGDVDEVHQRLLTHLCVK